MNYTVQDVKETYDCDQETAEVIYDMAKILEEIERREN